MTKSKFNPLDPIPQGEATELEMSQEEWDSLFDDTEPATLPMPLDELFASTGAAPLI